MKEKNGRSKIIQLIHIAKSQIGISEEDYRAVLESTAKKTSCSEMSLFELDEVLKAMKKLGFKVKKLETKDNEIGWDASKEQMNYIKGMWELVARDKSDKALYNFIKRITGAAHPRFRSADSQKVIVALRNMMVTAGMNPDRKEV